MLFHSTFMALLLVSCVSAHGPAPHGEALEIYRRDTMLAYRSLDKRCGVTLRKRKARRAMERRALRYPAKMIARDDTNTSTCLLTPEITQGPYHVLGELVRQNITEDQTGVPLQVEIDLIDVETCEPINAYVDAWHCNATGYYSGYTALTGGTSGTTGGGSGMGSPPNSTDSASFSMGSTSMTGSATSSASISSYTAGADTEGGSSTSAPSDNESFLRGVWKADDDGHVTMYTIFPGWYSGRAQHLHIKVYPEGSVADNGSFVTTASAVHTGQFFFDNDTLNAVAVTSPYNANAIDWSARVSNEDDTLYPYQNSMGYTADMEIEWVNSTDISYGLIGSITVGLNTSYQSTELSSQYWNGSTST